MIDWQIEDILIDYAHTVGIKRNSVLLAHYLLQKYSESKGFKSYFCKDNSIIDFAEAIKKEIPDAKFIFLHRDPRDVCLSQYKRRLQTFSIGKIISLWKEEQKKIIRYYNANKESVIKVSYEEIINDEVEVLKKIFKKLDLEYLEQKNNAEIMTGKSKEWSNLDKPVLKDNLNKFLGEFTKEQIMHIEHELNKEMKYLNYSRILPLQKPRRLYLIWDQIYGQLKFLLTNKFAKQESDMWWEEREKLINRLKL